MKICPNCKNEYKDTITHCADCGVALVSVEETKEARKALASAPYPHAVEIKEYLEYCGLEEIMVEEPDEEGVAQVTCKESDYLTAHKQALVYIQEEAKRALEAKLSNMTAEEVQAMQEEEESSRVFTPSNIYQNNESKAEENKSSAYSFLIVGILGVIIVILSWFEKLPFSIGGRGNWFSHGVIFVIFAIFIGVGIVSAKSVKKYKALADKEADNQSELNTFLKDTFTKEALDAIEADTEEEAYFKRMSFMRDTIGEKYADLGLDASFVEALLDAHYDSIYEN